MLSFLAYEVSLMLKSAEELLEQKQLEEAFSIAKSILKPWMKMEVSHNIDDSLGESIEIIRNVMDIFKQLNAKGMKIIDFLIEECKDTIYLNVINYIIEGMIDIIKSKEDAQKVMDFIETTGGKFTLL